MMCGKLSLMLCVNLYSNFWGMDMVMATDMMMQTFGGKRQILSI